jgi:chromosome segregation ATPase
MKFRSFQVTGFAQLRDVGLDFASDTPSLVIGPNESGKSHLLTALIGTLFGLTSSEARACTPWDGEPEMCGSLEFEANDESITLVRSFLDDQVTVIRDGETIYTGRGRTTGRGIAEDERYRQLLTSWIGFSEMDIFRDLVFVQQDQLSDKRLGKQAPEIKRLITGSREASYETALDDLTSELDTLEKLPHKRKDREIELLQQAHADLLQRVAVAERAEAAAVDLRESEMKARSQQAQIQARRSTLYELLRAHGQLIELQSRLSDQTDGYERARRDWESACTSAERRETLAAEIARLRVTSVADLDDVRRTQFELEGATRELHDLQARLDASAIRHQSGQVPRTAQQTGNRPSGALLLASLGIALLSLLGAVALDPRALLGLVLALACGLVALLHRPSNATQRPSRAEVERQLMEREQSRLRDDLERCQRRWTSLNARTEAWLHAANEPDLASLIARLEQSKQAAIRLENTPELGADDIERMSAERQDALTKMALTQQRIEQLQGERPELLNLTPETVAQHRRTIEELDACLADLEQTLRDNEIERGVLNQTTVDDAAALRVALRENEAELARKQQLADALELAIDTLRVCVSEFQESALEPVADDAGRLLRRMTGGRYHTVRLDQQSMEPTVGLPSRDGVDVTALSRGTRDQLYLAIRLALVDALSGGITLPLIFDDPCVHFDADRLAATARLLAEVARERQVIILTKDEEYTRWFAPTLRLQPTVLAKPNAALT